VVLDASAAVEYLLQTASAPSIARIVEDRTVDLHVPALCDIEVTAALRRAVLQRRLPPARAGDALGDYLDLPLRRHGHAALLPRILALRDIFSAYDACYAALAERLGADLVTGDGALARAAATHLALRVEHPS
jgi:predicted nucleic acid-binding protein